MRIYIDHQGTIFTFDNVTSLGDINTQIQTQLGVPIAQQHLFQVYDKSQTLTSYHIGFGSNVELLPKNNIVVNINEGITNGVESLTLNVVEDIKVHTNALH